MKFEYQSANEIAQMAEELNLRGGMFMQVKRTIFRKGGAMLLAVVLTVTALPISVQAANKKTSYQIGVGRTVNVTMSKRITSVKVKNPKIAKAVKKGKKKLGILGVKAGTTTVIVKYGKVKKKLTIKVGATSIKKKTFSTALTPSQQATVSVTATNGVGDTLKWVSEDDAIVSIQKKTTKVSEANVAFNALVAHNPGTATITVTSQNTGVARKVKVTVTAKSTILPTNQPIITNQPNISNTTIPVQTVTAPAITESVPVSKEPTPTEYVSTVTATPVTTSTVKVSATPEITAIPESATSGAVCISANVTGATFVVTNSDGQIVQKQKVTDSEDVILFSNLGYGTYIITASKDGYVSSNVTVSVASAFVQAVVELKPVEEVRITNVHSTSLTRLQVDCSGTLASVDRKNFAINNLIIYSAVLSEDKTSVILSTSQMTEGQSYTLTATGLTINNTPLAVTEMGYQAKQVSYGLRLSTNGDVSEIRGDGTSLVEFYTSVYDEDGYVIKDLSGVEITFSSLAGTLDEEKILTNSEMVTNTLHSQAVDVRTDTYVTATITSAANEQLQGLTVTKNIVLNPIDISEFTGIYLNSVSAEQGDRLLLSFDQEVNVTDYTQNRSSLQDIYGYDGDKLEILVYNAGKSSTSTTIPSGSMGNRSVIGLAPVEGNNRALWAYLDLNRDSAPLTQGGVL